MTERVYLHVGTPKSGTTYLQSVMRRNSEALESAGVLVAAKRWVDRIRAGYVLRGDPRLEKLPPEERHAWRRIVEEIRAWPGHTAILSYELLAGVSAERAAAAIEDLDGIDVHVVCTTRDFAALIPSLWQERLKYRSGTPLSQWEMADEDAGPLSEWSWRTVDPIGVLDRWGATLPPERVHLVTAPRSGSRDELWHRFARACGLDHVAVDTEAHRTNTSLSVTAAELLRRVNQQLPHTISGSGETARWVRDLLAERLLAPMGREPIGVPDHHLAEAIARSERVIEELPPRGYDVVGDLEDLRVDGSISERRQPEDVTDAELVEVATATIAELLLLVRERTLQRDRAREGTARGPAPSPDAGVGKRVRARVRRAVVPVVKSAASQARGAEHQRLSRRIKALEEELQESRHLHHRLAEITDVVVELLLPAAERDGEVSAEDLQAYRRTGIG